jgi:methyl-accepting chemotaxis protein
VRRLVEEMGTLAEAAVEGRLTVRADPSRHQGDFREVVEA